MHSYKLGDLPNENIGGKSMSFINCLTSSIGSITVLTEDGFVFQGQIVRRRDEEFRDEDRHNEEDFIFLELICNAALVTEDAELETIRPTLFRDGDIVRINVCKIIAVGPSNGCPNNHDKSSD